MPNVRFSLTADVIAGSGCCLPKADILIVIPGVFPQSETAFTHSAKLGFTGNTTKLSRRQAVFFSRSTIADKGTEQALHNNLKIIINLKP